MSWFALRFPQWKLLRMFQRELTKYVSKRTFLSFFELVVHVGQENLDLFQNHPPRPLFLACLVTRKNEDHLLRSRALLEKQAQSSCTYDDENGDDDRRGDGGDEYVVPFLETYNCISFSQT